MSYHRPGESINAVRKCSDHLKSDELLCLTIPLNAGHQRLDIRQHRVLKKKSKTNGTTVNNPEATGKPEEETPHGDMPR